MRRHYTPAERALQLICAKAGVPFEEFQKLFEASQNLELSKFSRVIVSDVEKSYVPEAEGHKSLFS